jgi:hypothetical protein
LRHFAPDCWYFGRRPRRLDASRGGDLIVKVARLALSTLVSYALLTAGSACADGWSMSSLLPGKNDSSAAKSSGKTKYSTKKSSASKHPVAKPSVVDNMTAGPKKFYNSAKAMVTPSSQTAANSKGRQNVKRTTSNSSAASSAKPSGIKSWFVPEQPPLPRTVGEWMAQKRVEP